jgi:protein-L-isoaspartate(D-aspartate) O-methyltransferase
MSAGAPDAGDRLARERARMVADQLQARGITDPELLAAFTNVERHAFVAGSPDPYGDHALPVGSGQTISQPYVVARMTEIARPPEGWRNANILEVGTGSGYQAAILAELGARVTSIERIASLAESARQRLRDAGYPQIEVVVGDGTQGWPSRGPYRSILVTAGGPSVPRPLMDQLDRSGGRLVMPVGSRDHQFLTLVERSGDDFSATDLEPVVFVPLIGLFGLEER